MDYTHKNLTTLPFSPVNILWNLISINLLSFCLQQVLSRLAQIGLKEEKKQDREKQANQQKEEKQEAAPGESETGKAPATSKAAATRKKKDEEPAKHEDKPPRASKAKKSNKGKNAETIKPDAAASPGATEAIDPQQDEAIGPPQKVESSSKKKVTEEAISKDQTQTTGNSKPPRTRKSGKCPPSPQSKKRAAKDNKGIKSKEKTSPGKTRTQKILVFV